MFHKSLPSSSLFEGAINSSYRLIGFRSREIVEQFHEVHGGFAMWLDPFGMLDPPVAVNLLPALGVGVDLRRHGNFFLFFLSEDRTISQVSRTLPIGPWSNATLKSIYRSIP